MSTYLASLDTTQYVKISTVAGSYMLQSHRDTVRVAFSNIKPAVGNTAFHELGGTGRTGVLPIPYSDKAIWALAMTDRSSLSVTPLPAASSVVDNAGRQAVVSLSGELVTGQRADDVSINFQYGISTFDIVAGGAVTGTGVVGTSGAMATVATGTGVSTAELVSRDSIRYRSGHESYCSPSIVFATPEVNVNQYIGVLNDDDGLALGYQGLTPGIWFLEGSNTIFVAQADWNIDPLDGSGASGYTLNFQAGQVPDFKYVWHGFKNLTVEIVTDDGLTLQAHKFKFANTATEVHFENPSLPVKMKIERTAGTGANLIMYTGSWRAGVIAGREEDNASNRWFSEVVLDFPLVSSVRNNVMTVRNKAVYQGKTNHIIAELGVATLVNDGNKAVGVYGTSNGTLSGAGAYQDFDTLNSVLEWNTGGVVTGVTGVRGPSTVLRAGADRDTDVLGTGVKVYPGDSFTFDVDPGGAINGNFQLAARFVEYH